MTSSFTTNKVLEKPGNGDYVDTWNVPVNGDMDIIDQAFGGITALNATGGSATLTDAQYRSLILNIAGAISANVTYTIPSGKGGQWIVRNTTTDASGGPWTITIASGGGGTSVAIPRNAPLMVYSDGTNIRAVPTAGSNAQVIYNSNNVLTGSANLAFDGTTLTGAAIVSQTSMTDGIGNVRTVPVNFQGGGYTLQASDNGKYIQLSTGGVTVPPGVFSLGQVVSVFNSTGSSQTIAGGSGVTLILVGTSTLGNRSLSVNGLATLLCVNSNVFVVTGGGVS
jgi:hypothetical protein